MGAGVVAALAVTVAAVVMLLRGVRRQTWRVGFFVEVDDHRDRDRPD